MCTSKATSETPCATSVAMAEPAMPMAGTGPQPKINSGLQTISSATDSIRKRNGVLESPAPRKAALTKYAPYANGRATNMSRM